MGEGRGRSSIPFVDYLADVSRGEGPPRDGGYFGSACCSKNIKKSTFSVDDSDGWGASPRAASGLMDWLNYNHLFYFWHIVNEGGIAAASRRLLIGRPAISAQLKSLEESLGAPLFERRGRQLELTEVGRMVHGYAEVIFQAGREMLEAVRGRPTGQSVTLRVGIADVMAKLVSFQVLESALSQDPPVRLVCREDNPRRLFAELAVHELDLVLSDVPPAPGIDVRARSHVIGRSTTTLFAEPRTAARLKRRFPESLREEPFLMPSRDAAIRSTLELWFEERGLSPNIVAEFQDSALLKVFGGAGHGVFPAPTVVAESVCRRYGVRAIAELDSVRETFYAVTPQRRVGNDAALRILEAAREDLFSG